MFSLRSWLSADKVAPQLLGGRAAAGQGRRKLPHGVMEHAADERLLRRKVVVQRGDIHAGIGGHITRAQTLESLLGNAGVRGEDKSVAPVVGRPPFTCLCSSVMDRPRLHHGP